MDYTVPPGTRIGHVHLKVADLDRALSFYKDLLGFEITGTLWHAGCIYFGRWLSSSYWFKYLVQ